MSLEHSTPEFDEAADLAAESKDLAHLEALRSSISDLESQAEDVEDAIGTRRAARRSRDRARTLAAMTPEQRAEHDAEARLHAEEVAAAGGLYPWLTMITSRAIQDAISKTVIVAPNVDTQPATTKQDQP